MTKTSFAADEVELQLDFCVRGEDFSDDQLGSSFLFLLSDYLPCLNLIGSMCERKNGKELRLRRLLGRQTETPKRD
ncbi:hypothetical protein TNCT_703741 [Trichonephila clavata]|uniref:Uncharacterized protein n=1 Tax=Trichonephila clavata TaxID=2740835 RepID=A0A8X6H769_TRICU|nr:hypothetical protein TNCT_703741 [Trichonephila clavata]